MTRKEAERNRNSAKPVVEAFDVMSGGKWKWSPEPGEWCIDGIGGALRLVSVVDDHGIPYYGTWKGFKYIDKPIPILELQKIEQTLYDLGYETGGPWWHTRGKDEYEFGIFKPKGHWTGFGKKRYESVVNSVLELAKDLKKESRKK